MSATGVIARMLDEQRAVFAALEPNAIDELAAEAAAAKRVFLYAIGRNGLMLQGFAMRLAHLGIDAHFVGQLSAPPAREGDLLILAVALGSLPTADAVIDAARRAGVRIAMVTARPQGVRDADRVIELPAQTMADAPASVLPLGSAFELALHLLCEAVIIALMAKLGRTNDDLRARHANLL
jgi:6-phospho-3-hexuloisomerase